MQVTAFLVTWCDALNALCSFPPTGRLTVYQGFCPWDGPVWPNRGPISVTILVWHHVASTEQVGSVGSARPRFAFASGCPQVTAGAVNPRTRGCPIESTGGRGAAKAELETSPKWLSDRPHRRHRLSRWPSCS